MNVYFSLLSVCFFSFLLSCGGAYKQNESHAVTSKMEGTCSMHPSVRLPFPGECPICGMDLNAVTSKMEGTCSMHPSVRLPFPGECPICGMDLILLEEEKAGSKNSDEVSHSEALSRFAQIETFKVGSVSSVPASTVSVSGYISIDKTTKANIVTHMPGRVEELFINEEGEHVERGSVIAMIYSPELITAQKELLEANKFIDINPSLLQAVIGKLAYWRVDSATIQQILTTSSILDPFPLYAERSGVVSDLQVGVGDHIEAGSMLFSLYDAQSLWAILDVYEIDLPTIRLGDKVSITAPSNPLISINGRVDFIYPSINNTNGLARIRMHIKDIHRSFLPNMLVEGKIYTHQPISGFLVPKSAVLWTGKRSSVYVKQCREDSSIFYKYTSISFRKSYGDYYDVVSGVKLGDEVVQQGAFILDAEVQIQGGNGMMQIQGK